MQAEGQANQESVVSFRAAFTLADSLLCISRATAGPKKLCSLWAWQVPLDPKASQFVHSESIQAKGSPSVSERAGNMKSTEICWRERTEGTQHSECQSLHFQILLSSKPPCGREEGNGKME
jgi:hypothetical protein